MRGAAAVAALLHHMQEVAGLVVLLVVLVVLQDRGAGRSGYSPVVGGTWGLVFVRHIVVMQRFICRVLARESSQVKNTRNQIVRWCCDAMSLLVRMLLEYACSMPAGRSLRY